MRHEALELDALAAGGGHAERARDLQAADLEILDRDAQALGDPHGVVLGRTREQQRELLAAEAVEQLERAQRTAHRVGDVAQHGVADAVAVIVVDGLEVVEVGQHDADRLVGEGGLLGDLGEARLQGAAVEQAR